MKAQLSQYGGYGVDVKLQSVRTTPQVYWSARHNSYVVVPDERGHYLTEAGERVMLLSINGIGEIRWGVYSYSASEEDREAARHFGLLLDRL